MKLHIHALTALAIVSFAGRPAVAQHHYLKSDRIRINPVTGRYMTIPCDYAPPPRGCPPWTAPTECGCSGPGGLWHGTVDCTAVGGGCASDCDGPCEAGTRRKYMRSDRVRTNPVTGCYMTVPDNCASAPPGCPPWTAAGPNGCSGPGGLWHGDVDCSTQGCDSADDGDGPSSPPSAHDDDGTDELYEPGSDSPR